LSSCERIDTSRAETGSSATISRGPRDSERANPIRCRCPPENSRGSRRPELAGSPTSASSSVTRSARPARLSIFCTTIGSDKIACTRIRGSSEA
jgi:hypothetical protein